MGHESVDAAGGMSDKNIKLSAKKSEKFLWSAILFVMLSGGSKDSPHSPLTVSVR